MAKMLLCLVGFSLHSCVDQNSSAFWLFLIYHQSKQILPFGPTCDRKDIGCFYEPQWLDFQFENSFRGKMRGMFQKSIPLMKLF